MKVPRGLGRVALLLAVLALPACAIGVSAPPRLSIEFGRDLYLTDAYLEATPESHCGPPVFAPGGVEARAPLPDGTWYRVFAIGGDGSTPETVVLERGVEAQPAQITMRLDGEEGIVRLDDAGRRDAWGINHGWADWLRTMGDRVRSLECVQRD